MMHTGKAIDTRTLALGVLSITACVLFVGLMLVSQQPAYGTGMNDRGGDYIMVTQQISSSSEAVVVIDAAAQMMIVYTFDYNNKRLEILERISLSQMPKRNPAVAPEKGGGRRGG
jgi:hypothetical protein